MLRRSGILLPVASLPSPYGIGDCGTSAFRFVDWLHAAGQGVWAILPLLIPDMLGSPFLSVSAFAGNWLLISPERLVRERLLPPQKLRGMRQRDGRIVYGRINLRKREMVGRCWWDVQ